MAATATNVMRARGISAERLNANRARVFVEPLERGFGLTLGNALRRVLLSSLQGASITSIKISPLAACSKSSAGTAASFEKACP